MSPRVEGQLVPLPRRVPDRRRRHELEFLPAAVEIIETPASPAGHLTMRIIIALVIAAVAWACLGKVDIIATASGRIIPSGKVKLVQPLEIGIVKAIHVTDGRRVSAGQVLIELDPTTNAADQRRIASDLLQAELDAARNTALISENPEAFVAPRDADDALVDAARNQLVAELAQHRAKLDGLDRQTAGKTAERNQAKATIAKLEAALPYIQERAQLYDKLRTNQYVSRVSVLQAEQALVEATNDLSITKYQLEGAEAAIAALRQARLEADAEFRHRALDDLAKARQKVAELQQEQVKAAQRTGQQILRAPVDGTVEQLAVHTVGGVVTPAQVLLVLVPNGSKLEIEATLANRDVGFVEAGQEVEVKIEAFTYTRYGLLHGLVESVSRDALRSERDQSTTSERPSDSHGPTSNGDAAQGESSYIARVSLNDTTIETEQGIRALEPGMAITAEIKTGQRRIISYLLSPLIRYSHESLHER